ncbi:hypothetical protein BV898_01319 [Hypsibius exemplaris]|uniref:Uncharacterized protein n=1 Tax=Hypsibius exemplaris TaxID=2072580 RepID=A0A1W0XB46_HYPEX|nr:hypothetical protein BV898_01319 [Hypsibius exemplaris]
MRLDYRLTYDTLRQFWERQLAADPNRPSSNADRQEDIRRVAETFTDVARQSGLNLPADDFARPSRATLPPQMADLMEEIDELKYQFGRLERAYHEEKRLRQESGRQCAQYYDMARESNAEALRQLAATKRLNKLVYLMSYYLPPDHQAQRHVRKIVHGMSFDGPYSTDFQPQDHQVKALEYRRSNRDLDQDLNHPLGKSLAGRGSCRAIIPWRDHHLADNNWAPHPFSSESPLYNREDCQFPTNGHNFEDDEPPLVYGPHRLQSLHLNPGGVNKMDDCRTGPPPLEKQRGNGKQRTCFGINFTDNIGRMEVVRNSFKYLEQHLGNLANLFDDFSDGLIGK